MYGDLVKIMKNIMTAAALVSGFTFMPARAEVPPFEQEIHWDWSKIDTSDLNFPKNFLWGTGLCEYQVSGSVMCPHSNWAKFEQEKWWFGNPIARGEKSGVVCDHWNRYKSDIQLMKKLGVNSYRLSVEWSKIEPAEGYFDVEVIAHYRNVCQELIANGITPMITLHHFSHPQWFSDMGEFTTPDTIPYFVRFAERMFTELHDLVPFWLTINEPGVWAFQGYIRGVYPPQRKNMRLAGEVTKNLILCHIATYRALKKLPGGDTAHVGIVHDIVHFDTYHPDSRFEKLITFYANHMMHDAVTQFLITKKLVFHVPGLAHTEYELADKNEKILDFVGLNYYSHALINWQWPVDSTYRPGDVRTDMPYAIYPEGFYRAIQSVARIGVPIYITENGCSDAKDDRRERWLKGYIYAMSKAIKDGYDVRGYFYWSLMDVFEWDMGYKAGHYGLYSVDFNSPERTRTLCKSAHYYQEVIAKSLGDTVATKLTKQPEFIVPQVDQRPPVATI